MPTSSTRKWLADESGTEVASMLLDQQLAAPDLTLPSALALAMQLRRPLVTADLRLVDAMRSHRSTALDRSVVPLAEMPSLL